MSQDWMGFLAKFVDQIRSFGAQFEAKKVTRDQIFNVIGEYFIEAHAFGEPKLHESMVNAWNFFQEAMDKFEERFGDEGLTPHEAFIKHMCAIFNDMRLMSANYIPATTRMYYWYHYDLEVERPHLH